MKKGKIVVLDDNRNVLSALELLFRNRFEEAAFIPYPFELLETVRKVQPDVVLLDMNFKAGINTGNEGLYWLSEVKKLYPDLPVVLFTAYADVDLAVRALKRGASDFVVKPWDNQKLLETLGQAMESRPGGAEKAEEPLYLGRSAAMQRIVELLDKVAATDANLLLTGENGTGKEVFAKYVHRRSSRRDKPLVQVDMGAITESLFESELFGHVKGAFTDAVTARKGKIEAPDGGTLFLDEIGNLAPGLQAKLLVALQRREIVRVGDNVPVPFDVRLITATNSDLFESVSEGRFREDLLYRINTIRVEIPPLRERPEDLTGLAELFARHYSEVYRKAFAGIDKGAMDKLAAHSWPGNVRELRHAVEKAVILSGGGALTAEDFSLDHVRGRSPSGAPVTIEAMEKELIRQTLLRTGYNISLSADELGISRPTLYAKIKKYGL